ISPRRRVIVVGGRPPHLFYDGRRSSSTAKLAPSSPPPAPTMRDFLQQRLIRVLDAQCGTPVGNGSTRACDWSLAETATPTKKTDRSSVEAHAAQTGKTLPLVDAQTSATARSVKRRGPRPGRPRGYDHSVLVWLAAVRMAATRTTVRRFWTLAGKDPSYGFAVLARLRKDGLIDSVPLTPGTSGAGMTGTILTRSGWRAVGKREPVGGHSPRLSSQHSNAWCAFADCLTERQASGWDLVHGVAAFEAIRKSAAARYRGHSLTSTEQVMRDRVRKAPAVDLPVPVFIHRDTPAIWLVVHILPGRNLRGWLDRLPDLRLFAPLQLEVVCGSGFDRETVERDIGRWARARKVEAALHWPALPNAHPDPISELATGQDLYQRYLGKSVFSLI